MNQEEQNLLSALKGAQRRWISLGAKAYEIFEVYNKVKGLKDWYKEFSNIASRFEKMADITEDNFVKASNYLKAVAYYHIAQLSLYEDTDEKKQTFYSSVRAYNKAAKYFWGPVERVEYPFMETILSAYLRKVPGIERAPCIIMIKGIDSSSEAEGQLVSDYFLEKGFFTFDIYCPGQYEARFKGLPMTPDFERPVAAAINYLETRSDVDSDRIALFGSSFGGFIAPRAASLEPRIKACVSVGGFYSLDEFDFNRHYTLHLLNDMKITAAEYPQRRKNYTLEGVIDKMTCPLLVVNGGNDTTMPVSNSIKIYDKALCPKDLFIYEGLNHCAWVEKKEVLFDIADWIWKELPG